MKFCISAVFLVVVEDCDRFLDNNLHNLYTCPKTPQLTCVSHDRIKKNHSRLCNVLYNVFSRFTIARSQIQFTLAVLFPVGSARMLFGLSNE